MIIPGLASLILLTTISGGRIGVLSPLVPLIVPNFLAYLSVTLIPMAFISWIFSLLYPDDNVNGSGKRASKEIHGGALIGFLERTLIFLLLLISSSCIIPVKDAIGSLAIIIAAKAIFRFQGKSQEAEWYITGTFLSLTSGLALSWFSLYLIWGRLGC